MQGFGVLIAIREDENKNLTVRVVSENSGLVLGLSPKYLFCLASFTDLLNQDQEHTLRDHITFCRDEQEELHDLDGPEVFLLSGESQDHRGEWKCWCAIHIVPQTDLIVLELELEEDHLFPLMTPLEEQNAEGKMRTNVEPYEPTEEDLIESTAQESKPLRLLNRRQLKNRSTMEHFSILSQVNEQLAAATDLKTFVKIVVGVFKEITGFHRVMVYQVLTSVVSSDSSSMRNGTAKSLQNWWIGRQQKICIAVYTFRPPIFQRKLASCTPSTKFECFTIATNRPLVSCVVPRKTFNVLWI